MRSLLREVRRSHMPRRASGSIPEVGSSSITTWAELEKVILPAGTGFYKMLMVGHLAVADESNPQVDFPLHPPG